MIFFRFTICFSIKYIFLIVVLFCAFQGHAQLSEVKKHRLDSVYQIATDTSKELDTRLSAYNRSSWISVYKDYELGLKITSEYLKLAKSSQKELRIAKASHFKGYTEMMLGDFDTALKTYQEGLKAAINIENKLQIADLYGDLGNLKLKIGQYEEAIDYHMKCLEIADLEALTIQQARARINIGEIYEIQGKYKQSLQMLQEALSICIDNELGGFRSSIYESLGNINLNIREFETASNNYKNALKYSERFININRKIQSLQKLGQLNEVLDSLEIASQYYNNALQIASLNEVPVFEAKLLSDLASISLKQQKTKEAFNYILESIALFEKHGIKENLDEVFLIAAQIYKELNQRKRSAFYYQKSYNLAKQSKNINALKKASEGLAMAFETNGNRAKSIEFYKEFIQYSNQIRDEDGIKEIIRLKIHDDYREKTITDSISKINEIKLLEAEHDKKEAQSNLKTYIAFSGIGILSFGLLFVGYSFIQKRKITTVLTKKNQIISQALSDNEVLLKEVHHRVKNNMQVVSSILQLKAKNTENESAKVALLDSQKRIDSMQLAHKKMYQKGNYEQIEIIEYYTDIVALLLDQIEKPQDSFTVSGKNLWIDVEQAQALGFIIHEMIANSIKYAWSKTQAKKVDISIVKTDTKIQIEYADNGKGMPTEFDISTSKSFGMKLIHSLATRQLLGTIELNNQNGFYAKLIFNERQKEV